MGVVDRGSSQRDAPGLTLFTFSHLWYCSSSAAAGPPPMEPGRSGKPRDSARPGGISGCTARTPLAIGRFLLFHA